MPTVRGMLLILRLSHWCHAALPTYCQYPDDGRRESALQAEAIHRDGGRGVIVRRKCDEACDEDGIALCTRALPGLPVGSWRAEVGGVHAQVVSEGRVCGCVVNVVALSALVEGAKAAAKNSFAVAIDVDRESDARLEGVVVVFDEAARDAVDSSEFHSVEVVRHCVND